jgi:ureidoglycolate hydrolase
MESIEKYQTEESGYHPFIIREGWQVAQLNYMPEQHMDNINKLDIHHLTDEVFILLEGNAVLIAANINKDEVKFEATLLQPNVTYNIPKKTWHNIAMQEGCKIIIVEKSGTHIDDYKFHALTQSEQEELKDRVNTLFEEANTKVLQP